VEMTETGVLLLAELRSLRQDMDAVKADSAMMNEQLTAIDLRISSLEKIQATFNSELLVIHQRLDQADVRVDAIQTRWEVQETP